MLNAVGIIFSPAKIWERITLANPNWILVFVLSLLPMMALSGFVEGYGISRWGSEYRPGMGAVKVSDERVIRYIAVSLGLSLAVVLVGSYFLKSVAESFNLRATFGQCFTLLAFGYIPILFLQMADAIPQINTWICWAVGVALALRVLYHGVALWLKPEQTKGFGLFIFCVIFVGVLSGLAHFVALSVLQGKLWK